MSASSSHSLDLPLGPDCKMWCDTYMEITRVSYKWTIHNFSFRPEENGTYLESPTFAADGNDEIKWCMRLYPKGDKEFAGRISLDLHLKAGNKTVQAKFRVSILNAKQEEREELVSDVQTFGPNHFRSWGWGNFIGLDFLMKEANNLLCDDKLTLYCEVKFSADSINVSSQKKDSEVPVCQLSEDLGKLFHSKDFSDMVLNAKGREFHVHKNILSARSAVFAAMLKHEVKETVQNRVEITDIEPEVLEEILGFIYTGKSPHLKEMADALLAAANKYALDGLKALCEETLSSRLSIDNVADVLVLADIHNADRLKFEAMGFINLHVVDATATDGWKTMEANQPYLITEVCKSLATLDTRNLLKSS